MIAPEDIARIHEFYQETELWRKELILSGYRVFAGFYPKHGFDLLAVSDGGRQLDLYVKDLGTSFEIRVAKGRLFDGRVERRSAQRVMDYISEKLREP
jgi:hypothetical protein